MGFRGYLKVTFRIIEVHTLNEKQNESFSLKILPNHAYECVGISCHISTIRCRLMYSNQFTESKEKSIHRWVAIVSFPTKLSIIKKSLNKFLSICGYEF